MLLCNYLSTRHALYVAASASPVYIGTCVSGQVAVSVDFRRCWACHPSDTPLLRTSRELIKFEFHLSFFSFHVIYLIFSVLRVSLLSLSFFSLFSLSRSSSLPVSFFISLLLSLSLSLWSTSRRVRVRCAFSTQQL